MAKVAFIVTTSCTSPDVQECGHFPSSLKTPQGESPQRATWEHGAGRRPGILVASGQVKRRLFLDALLDVLFPVPLLIIFVLRAHQA